MAQFKYLVVCDQGEWKINLEGRLHGNYQTEKQALSRAMEEAFSNSMKGHKAVVLTQDLMGEFKVQCDYGRDGPHRRK